MNSYSCDFIRSKEIQNYESELQTRKGPPSFENFYSKLFLKQSNIIGQQESTSCTNKRDEDFKKRGKVSNTREKRVGATLKAMFYYNTQQRPRKRRLLASKSKNLMLKQTQFRILKSFINSSGREQNSQGQSIGLPAIIKQAVEPPISSPNRVSQYCMQTSFIDWQSRRNLNFQDNSVVIIPVSDQIDINNACCSNRISQEAYNLRLFEPIPRIYYNQYSKTQNLMTYQQGLQFNTLPLVTEENPRGTGSLIGRSLNKDSVLDVNKPPNFENKLLKRDLTILKPLSEIKNEESKTPAFSEKEKEAAELQNESTQLSNSKKAPPKREGDWRCPECKNNNFAWRISCNRCETPKPPSEIMRIHVSLIGPPGFYRDGDWQCFSCRNVNFKRRDACKRCGKQKPEEYKALGRQRGPSSADIKSNEQRFEKKSTGGAIEKKRPKSRSRSAERTKFNQ